MTLADSDLDHDVDKCGEEDSDKHRDHRGQDVGHEAGWGRSADQAGSGRWIRSGCLVFGGQQKNCVKVSD